MKTAAVLQMEAMNKKLRHGECWVDCNAAKDAYESIKKSSELYYNLSSTMGSGQISRIIGTNEKGKLHVVSRVLESNARKFADLCNVDPSRIIIPDIDNFLQRQKSNTTTETRVFTLSTSFGLLDNKDCYPLDKSEKIWLFEIFSREIFQMLTRWNSILNTDGHQHLLHQITHDRFILNLFPKIRIRKHIDTHLIGSKRLGLYRIDEARKTISSYGELKLIISPAHAATIALLEYLKSVENFPINFDTKRLHSVEIMDQAMQSSFEYDGFSLTAATTGAFLASGVSTYHPALAMPGMSHGVLSTSQRLADTQEAEVLLMKHIPSSELLVAQQVMSAMGLEKMQITHAEPDETTRQLSHGFKNTHAIIGFPHYEFNKKYNKKVYVPLGFDGKYFSREVVLFLGNRIVDSPKLMSAISCSIQYAWLCLLENKAMREQIVRLIINNSGYIETLIRVTGIKTIHVPKKIDSELTILSTNPFFSVKKCSLEDILELRSSVLRTKNQLEIITFDNDSHETTRHYAAYDAMGCAVGCVTLVGSVWNGREAWQLRGMAVAGKHRLRGVGRSLIRYMINDLSTNKLDRIVWCDARESAVRFYEKSGWRVASRMFVNGAAGLSRKLVRDSNQSRSYLDADLFPF